MTEAARPALIFREIPVLGVVGFVSLGLGMIRGMKKTNSTNMTITKIS